MDIKVFVYGTLKPGELYHAEYCQGRVVASCEAIVKGKLFDLLLGYPAMTAGSDWVYGFLFTFADRNVLKTLDELEDFNPDRPIAENDYQRREIEVFDLQQRSLGFAWAYLMSRSQVQRLGGTWLPSGVWSKNLGNG